MQAENTLKMSVAMMVGKSALAGNHTCQLKFDGSDASVNLDIAVEGKVMFLFLHRKKNFEKLKLSLSPQNKIQAIYSL